MENNKDVTYDFLTDKWDSLKSWFKNNSFYEIMMSVLIVQMIITSILMVIVLAALLVIF